MNIQLKNLRKKNEIKFLEIDVDKKINVGQERLASKF